MRQFWVMLLMMFGLGIVSHEGAGGDDDLLDTDLDTLDEGEGDTPPPPVKDEEEKKEPPSAVSEEDKALLEQLRQERALGDIEKEMRAEYGEGFKMSDIVAHLKELEAKEPGKGNALFNRTGIENVYLKHFARKSGPEFDGAGRGGAPLSGDELIAKINNGEASDKERHAFYSKYA